MKVQLTKGAYQARSLIAAAQRCVNLYAEKNPLNDKNQEEESFSYTYYPTPGSVVRAVSPTTGWRCLYTSSDNRLFGIAGQTVYEILVDWSFKTIGQIESLSSQCYMLDNGTQILIVDGSTRGYTVTLKDLKFSDVQNDAFYGSSRIDFVDGYMLFNRPGTRQWYISLLNQTDFDSLDFASKSGATDNLVAVASTRRNVFLFGENTTEIWSNTGGSDFTFTRVPGAYIEFGCASSDSICQADGSLYWLSRSKQGECIILRSVNYDRERISTFALENELQKYSRVDDAIAYVHQMAGHYWYVITFPTADKTWVFDSATGSWHELGSLDDQGEMHRHRSNCFTYWNGMHLVGDYQNGNLYELRLDTYTDNGSPVRRIRSFPHLSDDGNRVMYQQFQAAMQVGDSPQTKPAELRLRWSDTKGASWSNSISTTLGHRGEYLKDCRFLRLGYARNRVFELSWDANCATALNGAYIQIQQAAR